MGCDYYTWIETVVEYRNASGVLMTYNDKPEFEDYKRNYVYEESYDSDLEEPRDQLALDIADYGKKVLYTNGTWSCTEHGKQRLTTLCTTKQIPLNSVVNIYKVMNGYWR